METQSNFTIINASFVGGKSRKSMYLVDPRNINGSKIYKNCWIPIAWNDSKLGRKVKLDWSWAAPEYHELPFTQVSQSMLVETLSDTGHGRSLIGTRLVNGKVRKHVELQQRIEIKVPNWMMRNFELRFTKIDKPVENNLFSNEPSHYNIIDDTARASEQALILQERPSNEWFVSEGVLAEPAIDQWLIDNPEYQNDLSIL